jgi:hypothetical protein
MSLIQSWIIYTGGLGGGGAGGTGFQMATGFSLVIISHCGRHSPVRKKKLYHHIYH